jgi:hypothetical protein
MRTHPECQNLPATGLQATGNIIAAASVTRNVGIHSILKMCRCLLGTLDGILSAASKRAGDCFS